jgi:glycosyltransferase involved in cell wall biosynthesis
VADREAAVAGASRAVGNCDVTVVITCFNYGQYLEEAVESALSQRGGEPRVIVVDDGSTDRRTLEVLAGLEQSVEVIHQENAGVSAARNTGLSRANTSHLLVLDADDRLTRNALEILKAQLGRDPKVGFAYGRARFFGDWEGTLPFPPYDPYRLLYRHTIGLSALMRKEVADDTGGFDERFRYFEDWEFWLNALAHGWRGVQVDAVTLEYRRHGSSKLHADRRAYRRTLRELKRKHACLYSDRALVRDSELGPLERAAYRYFWGFRPVPARLEQAAHGLVWGRRRGNQVLSRNDAQG